MKFFRIQALIVAAILVAADQMSKAWILAHIDVGSLSVLPFFDLVLVWNHGISFGLFRQDTPWLLIALSLAIVAILLIWLFRTDKKALAMALGAVIGGALGNVIDRLRFGAVIDFLDFHVGNLHWPAFNVADSAIVLGIAFIVLDGLFFDRKQPGSSGLSS